MVFVKTRDEDSSSPATRFLYQLDWKRRCLEISYVAKNTAPHGAEAAIAGRIPRYKDEVRGVFIVPGLACSLVLIVSKG
eukprot:CAMPEP_0184696214 /NCGR_PEP_ID=MMETSP0313-20130426/3577_1 /TAXON_ID=2792 /ORGANISM="Porphyridium aerugineum, Strain SAG 1380-2" /LENGTH=78 /DNA_ID=CAMNT_0027154791 /DNA_START=274 /DNA_END=510 /DNA_ORIENTATION=-